MNEELWSDVSDIEKRLTEAERIILQMSKCSNDEGAFFVLSGILATDLAKDYSEKYGIK